MEQPVEPIGKSTKYHSGPYPGERPADWVLVDASDGQLAKWGTDPDCIEMEACAKALAERLARRAAKQEYLQNNPFDPRAEVSADARHIADKIVMHLWILFVLLPIVAWVLLYSKLTSR